MLTVTGRTGSVLDSVTLVDDVLTYDTGVARELVERPRSAKPMLTDAELYALAAGTSNGYVTISAEKPT